jgi:hypothetical protein
MELVPPLDGGLTQLLPCYSKIIDAFEDNSSIDVLFLDLRKAFGHLVHYNGTSSESLPQSSLESRKVVY